MPDAGSRVVDLVQGRGGAAQLCVIRDDAVVLDLSVGCAPSSLFWTFSAGKPYTALLVHLLAERGTLRLDDPVARSWPAFARHGKGDVTIRHVLQHRSGLPTAGSTLGDALAIADWDRSVRRIEDARLRWPAGAVPAYQLLTFGFILGEVVRRVTGVPVADLLRTEILDPLGVHDTFLGLTDDAWPRRVPLEVRVALGGRDPLGAAVQRFLNRRETRQAVIPSAGVSTTARDLAELYAMLLRGGVARGDRGPARILTPATIDLARTPSSDGEVDRYARFPMRWSQGFQLGGDGSTPDALWTMGRMSSPRAFGHNGTNCCLGWADPDRRLAVAYLTNRITGRRADVGHQTAVAEAVLREHGRGLA